MIAEYLIIAAMLFIPALALCLHVWHSNILPMFIPKAEIQNIATQLIKIHGEDAYDFAHMHEDRAWRYSENFEQTKWKKIGKAIRDKQPHLYG